MEGRTDAVTISTTATRMQNITITLKPFPCSIPLHVPAHLAGKPRLIQRTNEKITKNVAPTRIEIRGSMVDELFVSV